MTVTIKHNEFSKNKRLDTRYKKKKKNFVRHNYRLSYNNSIFIILRKITVFQ